MGRWIDQLPDLVPPTHLHGTAESEGSFENLTLLNKTIGRHRQSTNVVEEMGKRTLYQQYVHTRQQQDRSVRIGSEGKKRWRCRKRRDKQDGKANNSERINDKGLVQDDEQQPDNGLAKGVSSLKCRGSVGGSTVKTADCM